VVQYAINVDMDALRRMSIVGMDRMNCGDCGTKVVVISSNHGVVVFCTKCVPDVEKAFMSRGEKK